MTDLIKINTEEKASISTHLANKIGIMMHDQVTTNNQPQAFEATLEEVERKFKRSVKNFLQTRGLRGDEVLSDAKLSFSVSAESWAGNYLFYNPNNRTGIASFGWEWDDFDNFTDITDRIKSGELIRKISGYILINKDYIAT